MDARPRLSARLGSLRARSDRYKAAGDKGVGLGRSRLALMVMVMSASLAGCIHAPKPVALAPPPPPPVCAAASQHATAELIFARVAGSAPGPGVSEADFSSFLAAEVASRFRDGLTVLDAQDLKPQPAGGAVYGPSKVVMVVLPGKPDDNAQLDAIRIAYKTRFNQQTVLELTHQDCVTF